MTFLGLVIAPLIIPIVVIEGKSGWQAIRRAWDLSRRRFWTTAGFALAMNVFSQLLVVGPSLLFAYLLIFLGGENPDPLGFSMTNSIANALSQLFLGMFVNPLQFTAFTLLYYDLRVRTEGLDLVLLAGSPSEAPVPGIALEDLLAESPPAETSALVTGKEAGFFSIISLVVGGLYVLLVAVIFFVMIAAFAAAESGGF
jgi:hypothetical protein